MRERLVLWDIDKTLLCAPKNEAIFFDVLGGEPQNLQPGQVIKMEGKTDLQILQELCSLSDTPFDDYYLKALDDMSKNEWQDYGTCIQTPGIVEALIATSKAGYRNGVCTGNTQSRGLAKLNSAGLNPYLDTDQLGFFLGNYSTRSEGARGIRKRYSDALIVVVGDSRADYEMALLLDGFFWQVGNLPFANNRKNVLGVSTDFTGDSLPKFIDGITVCQMK